MRVPYRTLPPHTSSGLSTDRRHAWLYVCIYQCVYNTCIYQYMYIIYVCVYITYVYICVTYSISICSLRVCINMRTRRKPSQAPVFFQDTERYR
jgi:hypothetical protein